MCPRAHHHRPESHTGGVSSLCQELVPGRRLVGCSDSVFREKLAHVVGCFEMGYLSIRPNNMRRGGATQLFQDSAVSTSLPTEADGWASAHVAESQGRSSAVGTSALDSLAARAIRCTGQRLQKVGDKNFIAGSSTARWTHLLCSLCVCHSLLLGSWLLWRQSPE